MSRARRCSSGCRWRALGFEPVDDAWMKAAHAELDRPMDTLMKVFGLAGDDE